MTVGPAGPYPTVRQTVLDCPDARALAEFYRQLFGLRYRPGDEPGSGAGSETGAGPGAAPGHPDPDWLVLRHPDGSRALAFQQVADYRPPTWPDGPRPQMLHLDTVVPDVPELRRQRRRALALGATELLDRSADPEEPLYVFADPAAHPFCIFVADTATVPTGGHLRLIWPQWQGVGTPSVIELAPEFPFDVGRRGYAVGAAVLGAVLPLHDGPTATVPVGMGDDGLDVRDGVEAKDAVLTQLAEALRIIGEHDPARITTIGGECSVSVAPFSALADRYADDLAVLWIDANPDVGTGASRYPGYHAMAVSVLTGHGDPEIQAVLPATIGTDRVALVGLHAWAPDDYPNVAAWGLRAFGPDELRDSAGPVLDWLAGTGCSRVAIHFDVDAVDSNEIVLGLGADPDGLTSAQVRRVVAGVAAVADVVALTVAEYIPRQVMHLRRILEGFPLLTDARR